MKYDELSHFLSKTFERKNTRNDENWEGKL
jgi:hypothetical protein